jgi:hypothetical protein
MDDACAPHLSHGTTFLAMAGGVLAQAGAAPDTGTGGGGLRTGVEGSDAGGGDLRAAGVGGMARGSAFTKSESEAPANGPSATTLTSPGRSVISHDSPMGLPGGKSRP